ncbi:TetR/AcrR family transcriptional regulator [Leucobacter musarum]|uniref:TetR/AcrR family transcriptional regulator n=1 Tax=Leucobacter musarum TaxID=1930747 RepID=UPI000AC28D0C|nr:TetR family transcriptional regulator [Leucobacter musarum]
MTSTAPSEPRKQVITRAALCVIEEGGLRAASFRRIAARAEVPLGSLTYYFSGIEELLDQAFTMYEHALRAETVSMAQTCRVEETCTASNPQGPHRNFPAFSSPAFFDLLAHRSRQGRVAQLLADLQELFTVSSQPRGDCVCAASIDPIALHFAVSDHESVSAEA